MDSQRVIDWIQIVTGLALVIGLGLVGVELVQSRDVAEAQLGSDGFNQHFQSLMTLMGENPAAASVKACHDPRSLSDEELAVLEAYYASLITSVGRAYVIEQTTGLNEGSWMAMADTGFFLMFRTLAGRTWWDKNKEAFAPEIVNFAEPLMKNAPPNNECWISDWRTLIEQSTTP